MNKMTIDLNDLLPQEAEFKLSKFPDKIYTVVEFSLYYQAWAKKRYGADLKTIFENQALPEISEMVHHMLKNKNDFPTLEDFQKAILTQQDRVSVMQAVIKSIGLSQPIINQIAKDNLEGNAISPSQPTGAQSTTPSQASTTTP